jgi:hypothetical protein
VSTTTTSALQRRLVDKAVLAYVEWREECNAVWDAYGRWASAPPRERAHIDVAYRAALDREESAANAYAKLIARVGDLLETGLDHPLQSRGSSDLPTRFPAPPSRLCSTNSARWRDRAPAPLQAHAMTLTLTPRQPAR